MGKAGNTGPTAMTASNLHGILEHQARFAGGLSPVALLEDCLQRIEDNNAIHKAMIFVAPQDAHQAARQAEAEIRSGAFRGALHGIPIAVKDVIDVRGWPTTSGSKLCEGHIADRDAACVTRLREAGAVLIGKTNLHELTAGGFDNPWFGKVVNPLDPDRGTGGTSSGSAAAVAAGYCVAALGTDTGGSNRSTAAATGLVGFKPSGGAIPRSGVRPTAPSLDVIGPIARSVEDAWLVHAALCGISDTCLESVAVSDIRIGWCPDLSLDEVDPVVVHAHHAWLDSAVDAGATLSTLRFPLTQSVKEAGRTILAFEFARQYGDLARRHPDRVGTDVLGFIAEGGGIKPDAYQAALAFRREAQREFRQMLAAVDVLAAPVTPGLAPRLSDEKTRVGSDFVPYGLAGGSFRRWANFLDVPALALPVPTEGHLPASLQIVSLPDTERKLFAVCNSLSLLVPG